MCERLTTPALAVAMAALVGAVTAPAAAQVRAELRGEVRDASARAVPGATVTLTETATGSIRTQVTDQVGAYGFFALGPGAYRLVVTLAGFRPSVRDGLALHGGGRARVDVTLEPGAVDESIVVTGSAPALRTESSSLGQLVSRDMVGALPLNGRSFIQLAALAPGVARPPHSAFPRINGGRPRTNEYIFDGISVLQPEPGQVPFLPIIEEIEEFAIESNSPPAEFGRFNGGVVNVTTRAGANRPSGTLFGFVRHEALNGGNPFTPRNEGGETPRFRRGQYGGVAGGPILRNRAFFFLGYQGLREEVARARVSTVPTRLQREGIFTEPVGTTVPALYDPATTEALPGGAFTRDPFADNRIQTSAMDPVARALLQRYPLPTDPGTANNYRRVGLETDRQEQLSVRIDHRLTDGARAFARLVLASDVVAPVTPLPEGSGVPGSGAIGDTTTRGTHVASSLQTTLGTRALNEVRVGYTRRAVRRAAGVLERTPADLLGLPPLPPSAAFERTLPTVRIEGYQQLGPTVGANSDLRTDVTQVVDVLSWQRGGHVFRTGLDWRWQRLDIVQPPSPTGLFEFSAVSTALPGQPGTGSALASFLLGQVDAFSIDLQPRVLRPRAKSQEYFLQDDWRATDRLTLNLGLRYTLNFPSTEADDQGAVFDPGTQTLQYLGRDGFPRSARRLHRHNLAPRLGAAYRPDDRTVVRAAYGMTWIEMAGITTPFINPQFPFIQTVGQRSLDGVSPAFVLADGPRVVPVGPTADAGLGQGVFAVNRARGSGYAQQWNVAWQREVPAGLTLELAYTGSAITRLGVPDSNLNQLTVEQLALGPVLLEQVPNPFAGEIPPQSSLGGATISRAQLLKPFPRFTTVSVYRDNVGRSRYHGAQVRLERRLDAGLALLVGYTRSRLMDDASSVFDAGVLTGPAADAPVADSFDRAREWDVSNGDIPHTLTASVTWVVPVGRGHRARGEGWRAVVNDWAIAALVTAQSGLPLALTQATNFNAFAGFGVQRPNLDRDPELSGDQRSAARWFAVDAVRVAPRFTLGSSSRNPVRGPGFQSVDVAIVRRAATAAGRLEVRLEVFNLLNRVNLGDPNTVLGTPGFGSITSAREPRLMQVGVRLEMNTNPEP